jgi:hypothetical protein
MKLKKEQMTGNESVDSLIILACNLARIHPDDLLSACRVSKVFDARCCVGKVLRECYDLTQVEVGDILKRDHATIHFYEKEHDRKVKYRYYSTMYNELKMFARNEGYEVNATKVQNNANIESLKIEIATLKSRNRELMEDLKKVDSIKKSLLSLSI